MNHPMRCCSAPRQRLPISPEEPEMVADSQSVASLWQVFKEAHSVAGRERLALAYLPLVPAQTRQMTSRVPPTGKDEDLEGFGMTGPLEAIDRVDPDRRIPV